MQEIKHDSTEEFTEDVDEKKIMDAVKDDTNVRVVVHKQKSSFDEAKRRYERKKKRQAQKQARRKNR